MFSWLSRSCYAHLVRHLDVGCAGGDEQRGADVPQLVRGVPDDAVWVGGGVAVGTAGHGDTLAPWDSGMRFETGDVGVRHLAGPYFVVRWVDRWGTNWEHKQGTVRPITEGQPWTT